MSKTRAELVTRALEKLLVIGTGQSAAPEDAAKVDAVVDAVSAQLEEEEIYAISDLAEIDEAPFEWIAEVLAMACATDFGVPFDPARREYAEKRLLRLQSSNPTRERQVAEYF